MISISVDENILLRTYTPKDAITLFNVVDNNRAHLRPWLNWIDATTKYEHSLLFIEESLTQQYCQKNITLGIFYKEGLIGGIGMYEWNHLLKKAQIGYWISKEYEGKGIITSCNKIFIDFLFEKIELNKVEIHFIATNKRSASIAQKLNAKVEGVLRDSYLVNGRFEDLVITGILKKEWKVI